MVKLLRQFAPAKINLFLRVTGRRGDGYHELDSVFVPVSIFDQLDIELRPAISASVQLYCESKTVPADERNLALRAAHEFLTRFGIQAEVLISLRKEIPVGAGLGGGSSDAGAVLNMLSQTCSVDTSPLAAVAMKLGADVPFFLNPAPSRVRGIGERCEALGQINELFLVIAVPPIEVPTAVVFGNLRPEHWSGPAPDSDVTAVIGGRITQEVLVNDLEQPAIAKWPEIRNMKKLLEAVGARAVAMTGSGGAVFGIFNSRQAAREASQDIGRLAPYVRVFNATAL